MRDSDTKPRAEHAATVCDRQRATRYVTGGGRGAGHSDLLKCSACGRTGRYLLNYLSGYRVVCNGRKFTKEKIVRAAASWPNW